MISLLFLAVFARTASSQSKNFSDPYFKFDGICPPNTSLCVPFRPVSFAEIWDRPQDQVLEELNDYIEGNHIFKKKFRLIRDEVSPFYKAVLSEDVEKEDNLVTYFNKDELIHSRSIGRSFFNKDPLAYEHEKFPVLQFEDDSINLALTLLHHIYRREYSRFQAEIYALPKEIIAPLVTLTGWEIENLKSEEQIYTTINQFRKNVTEKFEKMTERLHQQWTLAQMRSFFKREAIAFEDFVYAYSIIETRGWATIDSNYTPLSFLPPVIFLLEIKYQNLSEPAALEYFFTKRDYYSVRIRFLKEMAEGSIISNDFTRRSTVQTFLSQGLVPEENPVDCLDIFVLEAHLAKSWFNDTNSTGTYCYYKNDYRIKFHHMVGLLMNMNEEAQTECHKKMTEFIKENNKKQNLDKIEFALKECDFQGYKTYDFWRYSLDQLEKIIKRINKKLERLDKYITKREEKGLSSYNGKLLKKYFQKRSGLANNIYDKIVELKKRSLLLAEKNAAKKQDL